jgi:hypothetical protein
MIGDNKKVNQYPLNKKREERFFTFFLIEESKLSVDCGSGFHFSL